MFRRIRAVMKKEFLQLVRDARSLLFLVAMPGLLLLLFGFALNFDVKHVRLALCDQDRTPAGRDFAALFAYTDYFDLKAEVWDPRDLDRLLNEGKASVAVVIPRGFGADLAAGREPAVQVLVDGSNSLNATTAAGYVASIAQDYSLKLTARLLAERGVRGGTLPVATDLRVWYNPELKSSNFLIPGLMAFILMTILVISTSFSIVREKERGTMEQIRVSPVGAVELIVGKTVPYILISIFSSHTVLLLGRLLFGITIKGSYPLLLLAIVLFLICGLGQGLLISSVTRTQQVAFQLSALTTYLPTFILSGFVFPIRNMPPVIQAITYLVPAKPFLVILRSVILKGVGIRALWGELLALAGFAVLMLGLSALRMLKPDEGSAGASSRGRAKRVKP
jgi:ABC-2 type transport system permease protein